MADLSSRLHCSRRTLYELAASKDDLVALVVERFLDRNFLRGIAATHSTRPHVPAWKRSRSQSPKMPNESASPSPMTCSARLRTASLLASYDQRCAHLVEEIIREGQSRGEFRTAHPELAAEGIMAAVSRIQDTGVLRRLGLNYVEATREVLDLLLYGLGINPDPGN